MAHRAFNRVAKQSQYKLSELLSKNAEPKQNFNNLLVLDFEATCDKAGNHFQPQEIIEFPCVVLSTKDWKVKDVFHEYVRPRVNPELTVFCTELTGIIQGCVDDQLYFPNVLDKFDSWLKEGGYLNEDQKSAFVISGDWDLRHMLPDQCKLDGLPVPDYFKEWIDLKKTFTYATTRYPQGLKGMARELHMPFTGKLHSGINDVHNMVRFIIRLQELHKISYTINSSIDKPSKII